MKDDFLGSFMGDNSARARLLRVFVFDMDRSFPLKDAAKRAGISSQIADKEIKVLEKWGVIKKGKHASIMLGDGSARVVSAKAKVDTWGFDQEFQFARALSAFVREISPMRYEQIVTAFKPCGRVATIVLSGSFTGDESRPVDILIAGEDVSDAKIETVVRSLEPIFGRELRYAAFTTPELRYRMTIQDRLVRDTLDFPHLVLLDRAKML